MRGDPHKLIEGCLVAGRSMNATAAYIYLRTSTSVVNSTMLAIPVDVLQEILEHVDKNDLATLCRVNKICCSCSRNVLYRDMYYPNKRVIRTLAKSTDLTRRVHSLKTGQSSLELATALRNVSSLRSLNLPCTSLERPHTLSTCNSPLLD
jgi:hypothetical protein